MRWRHRNQFTRQNPTRHTPHTAHTPRSIFLVVLFSFRYFTLCRIKNSSPQSNCVRAMWKGRGYSVCCGGCGKKRRPEWNAAIGILRFWLWFFGGGGVRLNIYLILAAVRPLVAASVAAWTASLAGPRLTKRPPSHSPSCFGNPCEPSENVNSPPPNT